MKKAYYSNPHLAGGQDCPYCGVEMLSPRIVANRQSQFLATREHVFPASQGGRLVIATCARCNHEKADMTPYEWIEYLWDKNTRRALHVIETYCSIRGVFREAVQPRDVVAACRAIYAHKIYRK